MLFCWKGLGEVGLGKVWVRWGAKGPTSRNPSSVVVSFFLCFCLFSFICVFVLIVGVLFLFFFFFGGGVRALSKTQFPQHI